VAVGLFADFLDGTRDLDEHLGPSWGLENPTVLDTLFYLFGGFLYRLWMVSVRKKKWWFSKSAIFGSPHIFSVHDSKKNSQQVEARILGDFFINIPEVFKYV
jgi:hypothetical protein